MSNSANPRTAPRPPEVLNRVIFARLMPLLIAAYILAFLDRTNIGMAKDRLEIDLGISATAYGIGAGLFFLTYALFEVPSNIIMHKVGARWWIMRIMITWGLISAAMMFVQGEWSFYILRMLLGIAEAGLFPGVMYYLTKWFTVKDRAKANGAFLLGVSIANIVGAPIGGLLLTMDGFLGLHGWQWMFLIEGLPACFLAFVVWKFLPDGPRQAKFLTPEEADRLEKTIAAEEQAGASGAANHRLIDIVRDRQIILVIGIYFGHQLAVYALNFFLPSIIGSWGEMSSIEIGLLTAVPWVFSAVGALILPRFAKTASMSKRIALAAMIGIIVGYIIGAIGGPVLGLIGFSLAAFNFFVLQPILFTFPATRLTGVSLAAGLALVNTIGLLGGFLGPYIMGYMEDLTGSAVSGLWLIVGVCVIGACLIPFLKQGHETDRSDVAESPGRTPTPHPGQ
ncbi:MULTISPECIES: MFS transporter [unclassified Brevibacterium]|uniref:MFS transporter n=1 Tax=unclassified Brevibacterium TaxID=2614124 RepID=UPI00148509F0|nr:MULTISPECIES: MFS transporter [unclassified Brevibacterium]MCM1013097.1 MFS transporter [Brevibacterium sp. XM4083]